MERSWNESGTQREVTKMKNPKVVADRIAEFHNEGVKSSVKQVEEAKRSVEEAITVGEKVILLVEDTVEDASARTTEETVELGHKLLDFAHLQYRYCHSMISRQRQ